MSASENNLREIKMSVYHTAVAKELKAQKKELTSAKRSGDRIKVLEACKKAVNQWERPHRVWPEDCSAWQDALDDVVGSSSVRLEDLIEI